MNNRESNKQSKESILGPFGWRSLAWAAVIEAAVGTGGTVLNVPENYSSIYSILAGQSIEAGRILLKRSRQYLTEVLNSTDPSNLQNDIPDYVQPLLNETTLAKSIELLDDAERKWISAVGSIVRKNPFGMKAGVKPWQVL